MMLFLIRAHEKATGMIVRFHLYGEERAVHMLLMRMLVLEMSDVFREYVESCLDAALKAIESN